MNFELVYFVHFFIYWNYEGNLPFPGPVLSETPFYWIRTGSCPFISSQNSTYTEIQYNPHKLKTSAKVGRVSCQKDLLGKCSQIFFEARGPKKIKFI